ncbi:MAG TPA: hypothetical protein VH062_05810 [Polyangiaceae bacterium]|jgi:hypothetical protein|nr:hypothetical protein [Polyangiaceae bacterium]
MRHRARALALASILAGSCPLPAAAQSTAAAEALFNDGRTAMEAKDYDTACPRFRESNKLDPAVGTLLNLAVCETARGRVATGWELFRAVAEKLPIDDPRRDFVAKQLSQIEPRLPHLMLTLASGSPIDTRAKEGDAEFASATFGVPLPMDPGKHTFTVDAQGYDAATVDVELAEGKQQSLEIAPGPLKPALPASTTTSSVLAPSGDENGKGHDTRVLGWVIGGVGVAGLGVGLGTGLMALGKKSTADEQCSDKLRVCSAAGRDAASSGRTLAIVSTVGWIAGALGVGAGAYFIITSKPRAPQTALSTDIGPGTASLRFTRTF